MSKLKKESSKKNNDHCYPTIEVNIDESGNKIRPDYNPGYQGFKCRVYLIRDNTASKPIQIYDAHDIYNLVKDELIHSDREMLLSVLLTGQNTLIGVETVSIGAHNSCILTPKEIFKGALLANAASIVICHNHCSGSLEPSSEDIRVTETIREAGKLMGIKVLDHLIISHEGYKSLNK